jgi:hypothetical protein
MSISASQSSVMPCPSSAEAGVTVQRFREQTEMVQPDSQ